MPSFADQMKTLTDEVLTAKSERFAAVTGLKEQTEQMLGDARMSLKRLSDEHRAMAEQCKSDLAANRSARQQAMNNFRANTRRHQGEARARLQGMLRRDLGERVTHVSRMLHGFQMGQQQLAKDFQEAARTWRQLNQRDRPNQ